MLKIKQESIMTVARKIGSNNHTGGMHPLLGYQQMQEHLK